ncbi:hypothetical protein [Phenylobacterium sp.]|jgi:hypothetical protein|uniref:hypothetical protein n=1 Tax=Phenylobacterium sp. TaxID=1871053 RepID=UPI002F423F1B
MTTETESAEDYYTLLAVRADGVAPVVDLLPAEGVPRLRDRAMAMLAEHASCESVEVWRGVFLVERFSR